MNHKLMPTSITTTTVPDIITCHKQLNADSYVQVAEPGCSKPPGLPIVTTPAWD